MSARYTTVLAVLKRARALIARPNRWIQGTNKTLANVGGRRLNCFCANGALMQASGVYTTKGAEYDRAFQLKNKARKLLDSLVSTENGVVEWNDRPGMTQGQVVELFDRAIARAETLELL